MTIAYFTKRFGIAVFSGPELLYFAVKTLKPPRTPERIQSQIAKTLGKLVKRYDPQLLLVKTLSKRQTNSTQSKSVFEQVRAEAEKSLIPVREVSMKEVKRQLCPSEKPTRAGAFAALKILYPELERFPDDRSHSQAEYYNSMLSAVVIGAVFNSPSNQNLNPQSTNDRRETETNE